MQEKQEKLCFTYEERNRIAIQDVDAYIAAGVSTELDCSVLGYPPAGVIYPNSFGIDIICIHALNHINLLLSEGKRKEAEEYIEEGRKRIQQWEEKGL